MIIIHICKEKIKSLVWLIVLFIFLVVASHNLIQHGDYESQYDAFICNTDPVIRSQLIAFLTCEEVKAQEQGSVEIFDIDQGVVVKKIQSNATIQGEVMKYLQAMTGVFVKAKAFPEAGFIIRVPLKPLVLVKNAWLNKLVEEVYILFPINDPPYLLILDEEKRPLFYTFDEKTEVLLKALNYEK